MPRGRPATTAVQRSRARHLQERLRAALEEQKVTLDGLARQAELNRRTVDKYFEGESPHPSFFLIVALAEALGLDVRELGRIRADG